MKEKTISDTIQFTTTNSESIINILTHYVDNNDNLLKKEFSGANSDFVKEIEFVMKYRKCYNLRTLIFVCQKINNLLSLTNKTNYEIDFIKKVFLGTLAFCLSDKSTNDWSDSLLTSATLGMPNYPMYKFMFTYIKKQEFNVEEMNKAKYLYLQSIESEKNDEHLNILYECYLRTEIEVKNSIDNISNSLKNNKGISLNEYVKIANHLIFIKPYLTDYKKKIDACLELMKTNIRDSIDNEVKIDLYISSSIELENDGLKEFNSFIDELRKIISSKKNETNSIDYEPNEFNRRCLNLFKSSDIDVYNFISSINLCKLKQVIANFSAQQLNDFRIVLNINFYGPHEFRHKNELEPKLKEIEKMAEDTIENNENMDKIQILQLKLLAKNISKYLNNSY